MFEFDHKEKKFQPKPVINFVDSMQQWNHHFRALRRRANLHAAELQIIVRVCFKN